MDEQYSVSEKVSTPINPNLNFRKLFRFSHVTPQLIEYLKEGILNFEVWGRQLLKSGYNIPKNAASDKGPSKQMLQEYLTGSENDPDDFIGKLENLFDESNLGIE